MDENKPKKDMQKIIPCIIIVICILIFIFIIYINNIDDLDYEFDDKYNSSNYDYESEVVKFNENDRKNIIITDEIFNINRKLILGVQSQNTETISDIEVYVVFFDGEEKIVGIEENRIEYLIPNNKYYILFEETPENFESYKIFINKDIFLPFNNNLLNDFIEYKQIEEDGELKIEVKNNWSNTIDDINFTVLYYNEKNMIIDIAEYNCFDLKSNKTDKIRIFKIYDEESREPLEYDRCEIVLNYAKRY